MVSIPNEISFVSQTSMGQVSCHFGDRHSHHRSPGVCHSIYPDSRMGMAERFFRKCSLRNLLDFVSRVWISPMVSGLGGSGGVFGYLRTRVFATLATAIFASPAIDLTGTFGFRKHLCLDGFYRLFCRQFCGLGRAEIVVSRFRSIDTRLTLTPERS